MPINIICDGLGKTADNLLNDFKMSCTNALGWLNNIRSGLPNLGSIDLGIMKNVNNALNGLFNDIKSGLSLGNAGNMALCLGISGISFNPNGNIFSTPSWLLDTFRQRIDCQIQQLASAPLRNLLSAANTLRGLFDFTNFDKLLGIANCLMNNCNNDSAGNSWDLLNYKMQTPVQLESDLNKIGLNIDGSLNMETITSGINPPSNSDWVASSNNNSSSNNKIYSVVKLNSDNLSSPTENTSLLITYPSNVNGWNGELLTELSNVFESYHLVMNTLDNECGKDSDIEKLTKTVLEINKPKC